MRQSEETLADTFQPKHYDYNDSTQMHRYRFRPSGIGPWPTVLMLAPALYRNGYDDGTPEERVATKDLTNAGFLVFQIEHRLAPAGLLAGQIPHNTSLQGILSGRPPQQTDDVKQQILAALAETEDCNGKIFLIGGSSGGGHALWVALDPASGNVPEWNADVVAKIKGVKG